MRSKYSFRDIGTVEGKLDEVLEFSGKKGRERKASLILDGVKLRHVTFPNEHGSRQGLTTRAVDMVRRDLGVTNAFFDGLVKCPERLEDYLPIARGFV